MLVKCHFCETDTHDKNEEPPCDRVFINKNAAWAIIGEHVIKDEYHVIRNPAENLLIGCDLPRSAIKDMIDKATWCELTDPKGEARKMKHGICLNLNNKHVFMETPEDALKAFEELYCNGK